MIYSWTGTYRVDIELDHSSMHMYLSPYYDIIMYMIVYDGAWGGLSRLENNIAVNLQCAFRDRSSSSLMNKLESCKHFDVAKAGHWRSLLFNINGALNSGHPLPDTHSLGR